jgi:hypothetical protein
MTISAHPMCSAQNVGLTSHLAYRLGVLAGAFGMLLRALGVLAGALGVLAGALRVLLWALRVLLWALRVLLWALWMVLGALRVVLGALGVLRLVLIRSMGLGGRGLGIGIEQDEIAKVDRGLGEGCCNGTDAAMRKSSANGRLYDVARPVLAGSHYHSGIVTVTHGAAGCCFAGTNHSVFWCSYWPARVQCARRWSLSLSETSTAVHLQVSMHAEGHCPAQGAPRYGSTAVTQQAHAPPPPRSHIGVHVSILMLDCSYKASAHVTARLL